MGMMRRGSLPRIAVICAGLSSFTRKGPETGRGEGRVIASAGSLSVRSGTMRRRAILAAASIPLFLLALWVRTPALPRTAGPNPQTQDRSAAGEGALKVLERAVADAVERLDVRAASALDAPTDPGEAFAFLSKRSPSRDGEAIVLLKGNRPMAWSGKVRVEPDTLAPQVSVSFTPFYTTLNVSRTRGDRRSYASAVLSAPAPANRLTESLESR